MKQKVLTALIVAIICLLAPGSGANEPERVMKFVAVMDLNCGQVVGKEECAVLTDLVISELVKVGKYIIIDRANRDKILEEVGFQQSGCVDESCSVEAGRMLGVGKLVVGKITKLGSTYIVSLQLINVETGAVEIAAEETCKCDLDGLIQSVRSAARKLMGQSGTPQPQPQPTGETPPKADEIKFIAATPEQQAKCGENMVYVPAGWFMMGCNSAKNSKCKPYETPYHAVYLDAYCVDKYEYPNQSGAAPKAKVTWNDAQGICSSQGKRLPTEAEWEKAARGTDGRVYPWGDNMDGEKKKALKKKYNSGTYSWNVSPYGAYDMSSSLWEWVADWYDENYYKSSPNRNPTGPSSGKYRVLRGGSWNDPPSDVRSSTRNGDSPNLRRYNYGFRCARTP